MKTGTLPDDLDDDGALAICGDCNDADDTIYPGAFDICGDSIDQDCDGSDLSTDADGDGENCGADCDDDDAAINTSATEVCDDATDNDCDGTADFVDADNDTYNSCDGTDCNDADVNINPGATEVCEAFDSAGAATGVTPVDTDCDGVADNQDTDLTSISPITIFSDDFETTNGGFLSTADSGSTAIWEHGAVDPSYLSGPATANSPTNVWATVVAGDYGIAYNTSYLTTPSITLTGSSPEASFWYWQDNESSCYWDYTWLEIDSGTGFVMLDDGDSCVSGLENVSAWTQVTIDLSLYAGQTVTLRFVHESDWGGSSYAGTYIDDFSVTSQTVVGDDDNDGYVDSCGDCNDASGAADASINPGATEV